MSDAYLADTVADVHAVEAARAAHGAMVHREHHRIALAEVDDLCARLHARALLGQNEFAATEIASRLCQQHRDLQREDMCSVEILVQAVVVSGTVLQQ